MNSSEFYFKRSVIGNLEEVRRKVELSLQEVGFGVLSEIRMHEKFKEKLNIDFRPYIILGICNPKFAYEAVLQEDDIGVFLPCKVVLKEQSESEVEVLVLDPSAPMKLVKNEMLDSLAENVSGILQKAIGSI